MKIYLAGPLFTTAEREFNTRLADAMIRRGHEVWLPQEHEPREQTAAAIFVMDVKGIDWAEVVVANMDGPDPDSGTCWECGMVYRTKPVVIYRTDCRKGGELGGPYNLMLHCSAEVVLDCTWQSVREIAKAIDAALIKLVRPARS